MLAIDHRDRFPALAGGLATLLVVAVLFSLLGILLWEGAGELSWRFLVNTPSSAGLEGGIGPVIASTALILLVCLAVIAPLGLGCAFFLSEGIDQNGLAARAAGYSLDVLAGVPSIVYALFGYQFFAITLGLGFSILSGGLTLACMALPLMVRTSEQALRGVPLSYRMAGAALAVGRVGLLWRVLLPAARSGLAAAVIVSVGRALAETAVLLFTAGYVMRMPGSVLDSGRALSVHVYDMAMHVPGGEPRAAATALVLVGLIVMINLSIHRLLRTRGASNGS